MADQFDKIIIGAGLYGLYSALYCGERREKILVIECDEGPFGRATTIKHAFIRDTIIQDHYRLHSNWLAISNGLIKTIVSVLIGYSNMFMQHRANFPGRMENNFLNSARPQKSLVRRLSQKNSFVKTCATEPL